jgi:hypothetical protein
MPGAELVKNLRLLAIAGTKPSRRHDGYDWGFSYYGTLMAKKTMRGRLMPLIAGSYLLFLRASFMILRSFFNNFLCCVM